MAFESNLEGFFCIFVIKFDLFIEVGKGFEYNKYVHNY